MASLLQQIVNGNENSSLVVIQDSVDVSGRPLLRCLTNVLAGRVDQVHVFLFDLSPTVFLSGFDPAVRAKVFCHDGWSDPLEWNGISSSEDHNIIHFSALTDFRSYLEGNTAQGAVSIAVIIDSLSPIILHKSVTLVCKALHQLTHSSESDWEGPDITQVICLLHQDVHDVLTTSSVYHIATSVLYLEPYKSIAPIQEEPMALCELVHRRKSGKVIRIREGLSVDHDYQLFVFPDKGTANLEVETEPQPDPTANLTFNLTLKDSERRAKEKVILPYTKVQERHTIKIGNTEGSGKIFYEPDEADDLDEEDPDDDLDV